MSYTFLILKVMSVLLIAHSWFISRLTACLNPTALNILQILSKSICQLE